MSLNGVAGRSLSPAVFYAAAIALLIACGLYLRWPVMSVQSFRNEDIAGITYNADLLRRGKLPLVDNLEYKAPGSFFITRLVWAAGGRGLRTLERFGVFWALLAGLGVLVGGALMFGRGSGLAAGLIYVIFSPITDSMTVNYNTWMLTPYVWATVLFIAGLKSGRLGWFVGCGALVTLGALCKRQGGVLAPMFALLVLAAPVLRRPNGWPRLHRWRALGCYILGGFVGFVPLLVFYLLEGGFSAGGTLIRHFVFSEAGWRYVGGELDLFGKLDRLEDGVLGIWQFMRLPALLATITAAAIPLSRRRGVSMLGALLGAHALLSFVGASLGFRFYMGYYLQLLPAAAWLAAHPDGPLLRWFCADQWPSEVWPRLGRVTLILGLMFACVPLLIGDMEHLKRRRRERGGANVYQLEAERIAAMIRSNSRPNDSIWIWGRWAWPVYYHSDRIACTRYYKVLGVVTTSLDNTWKRPTRMTRFNGSGPWREISRDLSRCKPRFIVAAKNESYAGWRPLEKLLAESYRTVPKLPMRGFAVYHHKDHQLKPPHGPAPASPPSPAKPAPTKGGAAQPLVPGPTAVRSDRRDARGNRMGPLKQPPHRHGRAAATRGPAATSGKRNASSGSVEPRGLRPRATRPAKRPRERRPLNGL